MFFFCFLTIKLPILIKNIQTYILNSKCAFSSCKKSKQVDKSSHHKNQLEMWQRKQQKTSPS